MQINFYQTKENTPASVDAILPTLLTKALTTGERVVIRCPNLNTRDRLNNTLWSFTPTSFLPHGIAEDGNTEHQPIFLTADETNPSNAKILINLAGAIGENITAEDFAPFTKVLDIFNSSESQTKNARQRWKTLKSQNIELAYYAQTETGWQCRSQKSEV